MKAFLLGHVFLGPFTVFTIAAAFGYPLVGAIVGLVVGALFCAKQYGARLPTVFMLGQLVGLTAVLIALVVDPDLAEHTAMAIAFGFIALGSLVSIAQSKPWTAELSAGDYSPEFTKSAPFIKVNTMISAMWTAIFGWFAVASWFEFTPLLRYIPLAIGGLISVLGPKALMRLGVKRGIIADPEIETR